MLARPTFANLPIESQWVFSRLSHPMQCRADSQLPAHKLDEAVFTIAAQAGREARKGSLR
jgi:hypothetical protein